MVPAEGVRLLELSCLQEALEPLLACSCGAGRLELREDETRAAGLFSALCLICQACQRCLQLPTSRPQDAPDTGWQVNASSERVCSELGMSQATLRAVFREYRVPFAETPTPRPAASESESEAAPEEGGHTKQQKDVNRHRCATCGKTFKKTFNLAQHVRTHTGERPFLCPTCGKSFGDASTLSKHQRALHSTERPLHCQTCGKRFYHAGHLRVHTRRHTGEKPYSCSQCGKRFAYPDSIKKHMASHSEQKQFTCDTCGRAFRWRESLKQHAKTHQQQPPASTPSSTVVQPAVVSLTQVIPYLETIRVEYY